MSLETNNLIKNGWNHFLMPCVAAGVAYASVATAFFAKTALQKEMPMPIVTLKARLQIGALAGGVVGTQMGLVLSLEQIKQHCLPKNPNSEANPLQEKLVLGFLVGILSAHPLAVLQGCTNQLTLKESLKVTPKQAFAYACREIPFVGSQAAVEPLKAVAKEHFGDSTLVELGAVAAAGAGGAVMGHLPDSYVARTQVNLPFHPLRHGMLGVAPRTLGVVLFSLYFDQLKKILHHN